MEVVEKRKERRAELTCIGYQRQISLLAKKISELKDARDAEPTEEEVEFKLALYKLQFDEEQRKWQYIKIGQTPGEMSTKYKDRLKFL